MHHLTDRDKFDRVVELLQDGRLTHVAIGKMVGVHCTMVRCVAQGKHFYQADEAEQKRRSGLSSNGSPKYMPTPAEIAEACKQIQANRRKSASEDDSDGWTPPVVSGRLLPAV